MPGTQPGVTPLGSGEQQAAIDYAAFLRGEVEGVAPPEEGATADERAAQLEQARADQVTRMLERNMSDAGKAGFVGASRTVVGEMLREGRAEPVAEALYAREALVRMAAERGVSVGGRQIGVGDIEGLSGAEREEAIEALRATATGADRAEFDRLQAMQAEFQGIGRDPATGQPSVTDRVSSFDAVQRAEAKQGGEMKMTIVDGAVTLLDPNKILFRADTTIDAGLAHNSVTAGRASNLFPTTVA